MALTAAHHPGRRMVSIRVPARVHLGLLQLSRGHSTTNMGVGFGTDICSWQIDIVQCVAQPTRCRLEIAGLDEELEDSVRALATLAVGDGAGLRISVRSTIPLHVGLGSKTALLCGVLAGMTGLGLLPDPWHQHLKLTGRGRTSGIGVNTARFGGFMVDAGHAFHGSRKEFQPSRSALPRDIPAVLFHTLSLKMPFIAAVPYSQTGPSGQAEADMFRDHLPLPVTEVDVVAGLTLFDLLPALTRSDIRSAAAALEKLQAHGFKQIEWNAQSDTTRNLRAYALANGATAVLLSSMGPTIIILGERRAELLERCRREFQDTYSFTGGQIYDQGLSLSVTDNS